MGWTWFPIGILIAYVLGAGGTLVFAALTDRSPPSRAIRFGFGIFVTALFALALVADNVWLFLLPIGLLVTFIYCVANALTPPNALRKLAWTTLGISLPLLLWWGSVFVELKSFLRDHPQVSIADRLPPHANNGILDRYRDVILDSQYRNRFSLQRNSDASALPTLAGLSAIQRVNLLDYETQFQKDSSTLDESRQFRTFQLLLAAHRDMTLQFRLAAGFGVGRIFGLQYKAWQFTIPPPRSIAIPSISDSQMTSVQRIVDPAYLTRPIQHWHTNNLRRFIPPSSLGAVAWDRNGPDLGRVVEFQPHAFRERPPRLDLQADTSTTWQIDTLSLVSILLHSPGVVYVSEFLPNLNELRDVPTRPLNSFESDALDELRRNQDVVIDFQPTEIRMIGAIRSAAQCIECHPVERGTLLGAFSYHLGPVLDTKDLK